MKRKSKPKQASKKQQPAKRKKPAKKVKAPVKKSGGLSIAEKKKLKNQLDYQYKKRKDNRDKLLQVITENPKKKIKMKVGGKMIEKQASTWVNYFTGVSSKASTKIDVLKAKKGHKKPKFREMRVDPMTDEAFDDEFEWLEMDFSPWDRKQIIRQLEKKSVKKVTDRQTGETLSKSRDLPEIISNITTTLANMASKDLFRLYLNDSETHIQYEPTDGEGQIG